MTVCPPTASHLAPIEATHRCRRKKWRGSGGPDSAHADQRLRSISCQQFAVFRRLTYHIYDAKMLVPSALLGSAKDMTDDAGSRLAEAARCYRRARGCFDKKLIEIGEKFASRSLTLGADPLELSERWHDGTSAIGIWTKAATDRDGTDIGAGTPTPSRACVIGARKIHRKPDDQRLGKLSRFGRNFHNAGEPKKVRTKRTTPVNVGPNRNKV
jgi:hypothetical protein